MAKYDAMYKSMFNIMLLMYEHNILLSNNSPYSGVPNHMNVCSSVGWLLFCMEEQGSAHSEGKSH